MPELISPNVISRYNYTALKAKKPVVYFDAKKDKSLTNQADLESTDINKIMARYAVTGQILDASGIERKPMYGDFTEVPTYHESLSAIRRTETAFSSLPASLRNRFNNDPQDLINFLEDQNNDDEAIKLGLKESKKEAPVSPEAPAAPPATPDKA